MDVLQTVFFYHYKRDSPLQVTIAGIVNKNILPSSLRSRQAHLPLSTDGDVSTVGIEEYEEQYSSIPDAGQQWSDS